METRARYVFVGLCSLLAIAVAFGALMFSLKHGDRNQLAYYAIEFTGGVAGLSIGNDVRFNGIRVGEVRNFTIHQDDPSRVRVIISVKADTPVRENSEASLTLQGITGLAVVDISGGTASSPRLPHKTSDKLDEIPFITSRRSTLGSVIDEAPNLIYQAGELLSRGSNMLSPDNQESLSRILSSLAVVSESLERQNQNLETAIENLAKASVNLNHVLDSADRLIASADKVIGQDLEQGIANFNSAFKRLDTLLSELEPGAKRLTGGTADELQRTLNEAQVLLRNLNALVNNMNSDPQRLFFGNSVPGIRIE